MTSLLGDNLIFIISQPRSGSTLLQLILSSHKDIVTTSESWIALHPVYALKEKGIAGEYNSVLARDALKDFLQQSGINEDYYKRCVASFLQSLYEQAIEKQGGRWFLDKTPRYWGIIPEINELFPRAKFIFLFRNPLAVLNSILRTWVKDDWRRLRTEYRRDLLIAPRKLLDGAKVLGDRCIRIKYEDLVTESKATVKRVCAFLDVDYSDRLIEYGRQKRPKWRFGDTVNVFMYNSPNVKSLNSWRSGFKSSQSKYMAMCYLRELGPSLIKEMGYDIEDMESVLDPPEGDGHIIPWQVLMGDSDDLLDMIELDLYLHPERMRDIVHRYAKVDRGLGGFLFRSCAAVTKRFGKFRSKINR